MPSKTALASATKHRSEGWHKPQLYSIEHWTTVTSTYDWIGSAALRGCQLVLS